MDIVLYSRRGCHLCQRASDWLEACGAVVTTIDIDSDPALAREYGVRVPVVLHRGRVVAEGGFDFPDLSRGLVAAREADAAGP